MPTLQTCAASPLVYGDEFQDLLALLLPDGGHVMSLAVAYIDESMNRAAVVLAGCLFKQEDAIAFNAKWKAVLDREGMPYFRMSSFTKQGQEPYEHMTDEAHKDAVARELLGLIKQHAAFGFSVAVSYRMFARQIPFAKEVGISPYTYCLTGCLSLASLWADRVNFDGQIAYFIESGADDQGMANNVLRDAHQNATLRARLRFDTWTFADKPKFGGLQAADMQAWLWRREIERAVKKQPRRKDLIALTQGMAGIGHMVGEDELVQIADGYRQDQLEKNGFISASWFGLPDESPS